MEIFTIIWKVSSQYEIKFYLDFSENYFLNKWSFLFSSWDQTKVTITWRKMMFNPGMKVSTWGQLVGIKFHPGAKYLIFYM